MPDFTIHVASRADLETALSWAAAEGWNPGRHDAMPFHVADPTGFLIGKLEGEPVASISVVKYSPAFGFLGLYIVRPEHRGRGHGFRLWQAGMAYLAGCTVGLDGVIAQQANYARSGFVLAYRQIRFGGPAPAVAPAGNVVDLAAVPLDCLLEFERRFFPAARPGFLAAWVGQPEGKGRAIIEQGRLRAYGFRRTCGAGFKIGPLFAEDAGLAEAVLRQLVADVLGQPVFLDVPEVNESGTRLAEQFGLAPVFETARMYRGPAPAHELHGIFGVTTFELG